ncbi:MAG: hypothetical protein DRP12_03120 [Candidatus Aenigmatarchaeota archaeon]|nr:MAG: hypothetical protein DRP12_03120 [Candidatus Aenigmarchaeota archaeon]
MVVKNYLIKLWPEPGKMKDLERALQEIGIVGYSTGKDCTYVHMVAKNNKSMIKWFNEKWNRYFSDYCVTGLILMDEPGVRKSKPIRETKAEFSKVCVDGKEYTIKLTKLNENRWMGELKDNGTEIKFVSSKDRVIEELYLYLQKRPTVD